MEKKLTTPFNAIIAIVITIIIIIIIITSFLLL